jgi:alpha-mannosidase
MSSDTGFALGQEFTFDYALVPHAGDWREAGIQRAGLEFNHPLLAATAAVHPGRLPPRWGLLEITSPNVVMTALKPAADGTMVVRFFEAVGAPTSARIRVCAPILAAEEVNLLEDAGTALTTSTSELEGGLRPFEIKSIRLRLAPPAAQD